MNVDEMKSGRELDALIAEKVMGFEHVAFYQSVKYDERDYSSWYAPWMERTVNLCKSKVHKFCSQRDWRHWYGGEARSVPYYSKYIEDVWLVWERVLDTTYRKMEFMWRFFHDGQIRIECFIGENLDQYALESGCGNWVTEGDFAITICRAALKAVGGLTNEKT